MKTKVFFSLVVLCVLVKFVLTDYFTPVVAISAVITLLMVARQFYLVEVLGTLLVNVMDGKRSKIKKYLNHKSFNSRNLRNDIAGFNSGSLRALLAEFSKFPEDFLSSEEKEKLSRVIAVVEEKLKDKKPVKAYMTEA
ncbi:MAG: hypothetical protein ACK5N8_06080 [Alphaproteobacteria bacterium]